MASLQIQRETSPITAVLTFLRRLSPRTELDTEHQLTFYSRPFHIHEPALQHQPGCSDKAVYRYEYVRRYHGDLHEQRQLLAAGMVHTALKRPYSIWNSTQPMTCTGATNATVTGAPMEWKLNATMAFTAGDVVPASALVCGGVMYAGSGIMSFITLTGGTWEFRGYFPRSDVAAHSVSQVTRSMAPVCSHQCIY